MLTLIGGDPIGTFASDLYARDSLLILMESSMLLRIPVTVISSRTGLSSAAASAIDARGAIVPMSARLESSFFTM